MLQPLSATGTTTLHTPLTQALHNPTPNSNASTACHPPIYRTCSTRKMEGKLRVSKEEAKRLSTKVAELEADRAAMERQAENDADVTAERVRAAGQRINELQGGTPRDRRDRERDNARERRSWFAFFISTCMNTHTHVMMHYISCKAAHAVLGLIPNLLSSRVRFWHGTRIGGATDRLKECPPLREQH